MPVSYTHLSFIIAIRPPADFCWHQPTARCLFSYSKGFELPEKHLPRPEMCIRDSDDGHHREKLAIFLYTVNLEDDEPLAEQVDVCLLYTSFTSCKRDVVRNPIILVQTSDFSCIACADCGWVFFGQVIAWHGIPDFLSIDYPKLHCFQFQ